MKITPKVDKFIVTYLATGNASEAYRRAYDCRKSSAATVAVQACRILNDDNVSAEIARLKQCIKDRVVIEIADVVNELIDIATSDVTEIVQYRRLCCRYCYGKNHCYQWRDVEEYITTIRNMNEEGMEYGHKKPLKSMPLDDGGYGFQFNRLPNADCSYCYGEGIGNIFLVDTRQLSVRQRKLIAGIKQTGSGVEITFRDRDAALASIAKLLGGSKQSVVLESQDGLAVRDVPQLPIDPTNAAAIYAAWIKGS